MTLKELLSRRRTWIGWCKDPHMALPHFYVGREDSDLAWQACHDAGGERRRLVSVKPLSQSLCPRCYELASKAMADLLGQETQLVITQQHLEVPDLDLG